MADASTTAQKLAAEVLGTFVLVFFGCAAALISGGDYVATALAFGLTVLVMVYAVGRLSGGHFNPAVSVGAAIGGRMSWNQVPLYLGAQLGGALLAGFMLFIVMHGYDGFDATGNMAQNFFGSQGGVAWWSALILETLMTAVFVWIILSVTDARNEHPALAPLAIGLALAMIHFASIGATGTSVNPARSIGVGVFAGTDAVLQLWLFILAPLLGGAAAGATYAMLFGLGSEPVPGSGFSFSRPAPAAVPGYGAPDQYQAEWNQENPAVQAEAAQAQAQTQEQAWGTEPIIQDGWQWDPHNQQWVPLAQPQQPQQQQPPTEGDDPTQVRPPGE